MNRIACAQNEVCSQCGRGTYKLGRNCLNKPFALTCFECMDTIHIKESNPPTEYVRCDRKSLKKGDHIFFRAQFLSFANHHALVIDGKSEEIIDLNAEVESIEGYEEKKQSPDSYPKLPLAVSASNVAMPSIFGSVVSSAATSGASASSASSAASNLYGMIRKGVISVRKLPKDVEIYKYIYRADECFEPDEVIRRVSACQDRVVYNLLANNCEHFATWAKCGFKRSSQIESVIRGGIKAVSFIAEVVKDLAKKDD